MRLAVVFALSFMAFVIPSCKKYYAENPRTGPRYNPSKELLGGWLVIEFTVNGEDSTLNMVFPKKIGYTIENIGSDPELDLSAMIDSTFIGGSLYPQKQKNGKLLVNLRSGISIHTQTRNFDSILPPKGPFLQGSGVDWNILKLYNGELKCRTNFQGKEYYLFMKKKS